MDVFAPHGDAPAGFSFEFVDPGFPGSGGLAPGVSFAFQVLEKAGEFRWVLVGGEYLVAAQVNDVVDEF